MLNQLASWRVRTLPSSAVNARSLVTGPRTVGHEDPAEQGAGIQRLRDPAFGQGGVEQPPLRVPEPQRVDIHKGKGRGFPFVEGRLAFEAGIEEAAHGLEALVRFLDAVAHVGRGFPEPALDVPVHHIGDELRGDLARHQHGYDRHQDEGQHQLGDERYLQSAKILHNPP